MTAGAATLIRGGISSFGIASDDATSKKSLYYLEKVASLKAALASLNCCVPKSGWPEEDSSHTLLKGAETVFFEIEAATEKQPLKAGSSQRSRKRDLLLKQSNLGQVLAIIYGSGLDDVASDSYKSRFFGEFCAAIRNDLNKSVSVKSVEHCPREPEININAREEHKHFRLHSNTTLIYFAFAFTNDLRLFLSRITHLIAIISHHASLIPSDYFIVSALALYLTRILADITIVLYRTFFPQSGHERSLSLMQRFLNALHKNGRFGRLLTNSAWVVDIALSYYYLGTAAASYLAVGISFVLIVYTLIDDIRQINRFKSIADYDDNSDAIKLVAKEKIAGLKAQCKTAVCISICFMAGFALMITPATSGVGLFVCFALGCYSTYTRAKAFKDSKVTLFDSVKSTRRQHVLTDQPGMAAEGLLINF